MIEFEFEGRFGSAASSYHVLYSDTVRTTRHYFGAFIGLHLGYGVINFKSTSIYLLGGLGYDGFDSVEITTPGENSNVEIGSLNVNGGIGIQHFPKKGGYLGAELLYNAIHYQNPGGTPLDGNGITLRLTFGFIYQTYRSHRHSVFFPLI